MATNSLRRRMVYGFSPARNAQNGQLPPDGSTMLLTPVMISQPGRPAGGRRSSERQPGPDLGGEPGGDRVGLRGAVVQAEPGPAESISNQASKVRGLESAGMELHQLEYLVAVAEEASFTRAAARVHVAQPGVSAQVRRLESELGQRLLDRSGRTIRLTEAGAAVLPFARAALDAVAKARLVVDDLAGLVRGQVTIGMVSGCALPVMAELLAGFRKQYPGVAISLSEDNSDRLAETLGDGRLDLALIGVAGEPAPGIDSVLLIDEELVAAIPPGH